MNTAQTIPIFSAPLLIIEKDRGPTTRGINDIHISEVNRAVEIVIWVYLVRNGEGVSLSHNLQSLLPDLPQQF